VVQNSLPVDQPQTEQPQVEPTISSVPVKPITAKNTRRSDVFVLLGVWLITFSVILVAAYLGWKQMASRQAAEKEAQASLRPAVVNTQPAQPALAVSSALAAVDMPSFDPQGSEKNLVRYSTLHTIIPTRPREGAIEYTVLQGDSVFSISKDYNLKPESILWANYDSLQDSPDSLRPGMVLLVPPVNGVLYEWKEGDTLDAVVSQFKAKKDEVLGFSGNKLDLTNPTFKTGSMVMIPGGERKFQTWIIPVIARGNAGVSRNVLGPGACTGNYDGLYGSGGFIWPSGNHVLSGNDFWSGHLGIDIAGATGDLVWASDAGVVVFAGWSSGGYGYMVMIDHGNGYQTVYGHLNSVSSSCGQSVYAGNIIGTLGSTGNSTGSHLHFEIRYFGQFVNPWQVLP